MAQNSYIHRGGFAMDKTFSIIKKIASTALVITTIMILALSATHIVLKVKERNILETAANTYNVSLKPGEALELYRYAFTVGDELYAENRVSVYKKSRNHKLGDGYTVCYDTLGLTNEYYSLTKTQVKVDTFFAFICICSIFTLIANFRIMRLDPDFEDAISELNEEEILS